MREFLARRRPDQPFFYWFGSANPHRTYRPGAGLAAGKQPADIDRVPACWPDTDVVRRDMLDYATEIEAFDAEIGSLLAALVAAGMRPITGTSLADLFRDAPALPRDRVFLGRERNDVRCRPGTESGLGYPARAIRRGDLFYVHNFAPDRWPCGDPDLSLADTDAGPTKALIEAAGQGDRFWQLCFGKRPADELYDLAADPDCVQNLAADAGRAADVSRLRAELLAELARQGDPRVLGRGEIFDEYPSPMPAAANRSSITPSATRANPS